MKNILNQNLLKSLISTDFLLNLAKLSLKDTSRYQNSKFLIPFNKVGFIYSDLLESIKDLKQVIRLLKFLSFNYKKSNKNLDFFYLNGNSIDFESLISKFSLITEKFKFHINPHLRASTDVSCTRSRIGILLNNLQDYEERLIRRRLNKKCYLVLKVDSRSCKSFNEYSLRNDLSDIKKVLFFFCFLRTILSENKV